MLKALIARPSVISGRWPPWNDPIPALHQPGSMLDSVCDLSEQSTVSSTYADLRDPADIERSHGLAAPARGLSLSKHLKVLRRDERSHIAYHALFGNLAIIDEDLACALASFHHRPFLRDELDQAVGEDVAASLYSAYYVGEEGEERKIVERWLDERSSKVSSGHFLGGLQITSSNACNFSCSYCFADSSDRRSPQRQAGAEIANISFDTACEAIDRVLANARAHGRDRIGVKFLGREPLVNHKVIAKLFERYSSGEVAWSITTNGSLVTKDIAAELARASVRTVVSIDGLPETNDALRTLKSRYGERSAYKLAMRGFEALIAAGVNTSISSVVSNKTDFTRMPEFFRTLRAAGCREIELTLAMQTDALRAQDGFRDVGGMAAQLVDLYRDAEEQGLLVSGDWIDPFRGILSNRKFRDDREIHRPLGAGCQATEHQISVEPNGDLFPCRAMSLHYGSLSDWSGVLSSDAYRKVAMRTYFGVPFCQGCPLEGHCQGTCLGSLEEESGDIYSPQTAYCEVYREVTAVLLQDFSCHI
jgi:uncharacterized protein